MKYNNNNININNNNNNNNLTKQKMIHFIILMVVLGTTTTTRHNNNNNNNMIVASVESFSLSSSSSARRRSCCDSISSGGSSSNKHVLFSSSSSIAAATATEDEEIVTSSTEDENENDALLYPSYDIEPIPIRIGHGFDIHRMAPINEAGQPIVIGGVVIPHKDQKWIDKDGQYVKEKGGIYETQLGVVAHSDGDVIYHSIVDAIFGALTLPDIGQIFQDTDPRWKGCDSSKFMDHAYTIMSSPKYGYRIGNIDVTLILERPKVATFKPAMKTNIVKLLHTTPGRVNIKARTHEQVDSVGELRSLSCHVVLTLERIPDSEKNENKKE